MLSVKCGALDVHVGNHTPPAQHITIGQRHTDGPPALHQNAVNPKASTNPPPLAASDRASACVIAAMPPRKTPGADIAVHIIPLW